ncbi:unnamed protein product [Chondrus crispus]|uniref:Uncharacterized protein n=1 Tax=Chondrus crispus TaxID=2769 RepID=R7QCW8_CHOCR|nr:unnamed protein product [Chondrus crispus]CDF35300.1 unnamed protein product [Chondrus crispus]|eukprot:XP_005715119.1 unnamed protein product [Chondrus crispus]
MIFYQLHHAFRSDISPKGSIWDTSIARNRSLSRKRESHKCRRGLITRHRSLNCVLAQCMCA